VRTISITEFSFFDTFGRDADFHDLYPQAAYLDLNVAKVGGLQSQGVKGDAVVGYREPLTTQDLEPSGFPGG